MREKNSKWRMTPKRAELKKNRGNSSNGSPFNPFPSWENYVIIIQRWTQKETFKSLIYPPQLPPSEGTLASRPTPSQPRVCVQTTPAPPTLTDIKGQQHQQETFDKRSKYDPLKRSYFQCYGHRCSFLVRCKIGMFLHWGGVEGVGSHADKVV